MRARVFTRPLPRVIAAGSMPFFLLHQPVILAVAFLAVGRAWNAPATWAAIALPAFVATAALSWALSRIPGARALLGVKPQPRAVQPAVPT